MISLDLPFSVLIDKPLIINAQILFDLQRWLRTTIMHNIEIFLGCNTTLIRTALGVVIFYAIPLKKKKIPKRQRISK
jgi:hypothetical protein